MPCLFPLHQGIGFCFQVHDSQSLKTLLLDKKVIKANLEELLFFAGFVAKLLIDLESRRERGD